MTDHYAVLGVARNATIDDIRRAYRDRMRKAHPDSRGGMGSSTSSTTAEVTRIAEAWNVLSSPARRAAYDLQLATGSAAGAGARASSSASSTGVQNTSPEYDPNL
ncbi:MAG: J domain-containing protein, partial [Actinomycetota bacterium]